MAFQVGRGKKFSGQWPDSCPEINDLRQCPKLLAWLIMFSRDPYTDCEVQIGRSWSSQ
jgi:hypothetical protein